MGSLIVEHQANIGTITQIDINGGPTVPCNVINGGQSKPINLPSGHYTATVTRIVDRNPITEDISFDIFDNTDTIYTIGLPPVVSPVKMVSK
jgi:hypothetical protein